MTRIFEALKGIDEESAREIEGLRKDLERERTTVRALSKALAESTEVCHRNTLALGFALKRLQSLGFSVEQIDDIAMGTLNLKE